MASFITGCSIYENCGPFVIVAEATLETLEREAPIIRDLLGCASRAATIGQMAELLDQLPIGLIWDWVLIADEYFEITDVNQAPPPGFYRHCVEKFFYSSAIESYLSTLYLDTTACYRDVNGPELWALVWPFIATARFDLDAGFDDLTGPVQALEGAGHRCHRDDDRIQRVFGHLMTDTYLRADEAPDEGIHTEQ